MAIDPAQKLAALEAELVIVAKNHTEAKQVIQNCEAKARWLQGGIDACKEILKAEEVVAIEDKKPSKKVS